MASVFKNAVAQQVQDQPTWLRYKGSILIVASGIAAVAAQLALSPDFQDTQWPVIFTTAATIVTALVNRFTQDGITPSAAAKLEQAGQRAHLDRQSVSGVSVSTVQPAVEANIAGQAETPKLSVYDGETTTDYQGAHRAGE